MDEDKMLDFLKGYAEILKTDIDMPVMNEALPLTYRVVMAGGCVVIETKDGLHVAAVSAKDDFTSPSMPIGPVSMTFARLFVKLVNAWWDFCKEPGTPQDAPS